MLLKQIEFGDMKRLSFVVVGLFLLMATEVEAQLNLKIGYSLSVLDPRQVNESIKAFNEANPWYDDKLRDLNLINGVTIGFRNKWESVALEFSWSSKFNSKFIEGVRPDDNELVFREVIFRIGSFSFGPEFLFDNIGIGATLDASDFTIRSSKSKEPNELTILDEFSLSSHIFASYHIQTGDFLSLCFRPFVQIPFDRINTFEFEKELFPGTTNDPENYNDSFLNFGLMIIFYNGNN